MIFDRICNLSAYRGVLPGMAEVEAFLANTDLTTLASGKHLLGRGVYVMVSSYLPTATSGKWEAHRTYADLQYVVRGNENMKVVNLDGTVGAEAYDAVADVQFFADAPRPVTLPFTDGDFAIFLPQDVHMPGLRSADTEGNVLKLVFKLPMADE